MNQALSAALELSIAIIDALDEAGEYWYDVENVKRSISEADACDLCEECEAQGWIPDEDVFESGEDGPPHHPNCKCSIEYKERRFRVYV